MRAGVLAFGVQVVSAAEKGGEGACTAEFGVYGQAVVTQSRKRKSVTACLACSVPLSSQYARRSHLCIPCARATVVEIDGVSSRFCQRCHRAHDIKLFTGDKRSCDLMLVRRVACDASPAAPTWSRVSPSAGLTPPAPGTLQL